MLILNHVIVYSFSIPCKLLGWTMMIMLHEYNACMNAAQVLKLKLKAAAMRVVDLPRWSTTCCEYDDYIFVPAKAWTASHIHILLSGNIHHAYRVN